MSNLGKAIVAILAATGMGLLLVWLALAVMFAVKSFMIGN